MHRENEMELFEQQIKAALDTNFGRRASGNIDVGLEDGAASYSGDFKVKSIFAKETVKEAGEYFEEQNIDLFKLISELRKRSSAGKRGPIFRMKISLVKGKVNFQYYREEDDFSSIEDIPKNSFGSIPLFVYRKAFSKELIQATDTHKMVIGQSAFVQSLIKAGKVVPEFHKLFYSLSDLIGDVNNGGFNQYFERRITWDTAQLSREGLYTDVDAALALIDLVEAREIFREALAVYAHLYERVDAARQTLGISAIEKQETSDLDSRYYSILSELEERFGAYIKANSDVFAYESTS